MVNKATMRAVHIPDSELLTVAQIPLLELPPSMECQAQFQETKTPIPLDRDRPRMEVCRGVIQGTVKHYHTQREHK